jgi:hypothetical protein
MIKPNTANVITIRSVNKKRNFKKVGILGIVICKGMFEDADLLSHNPCRLEG